MAVAEPLGPSACTDVKRTLAQERGPHDRVAWLVREWHMGGSSCVQLEAAGRSLDP